MVKKTSTKSKSSSTRTNKTTKTCATKTKAKSKPSSGKGSGRGGARKTDVDKLLERSIDEVEAHFLKVHDEESVETFGCSLFQMEFSRALINNNFKLGPAYLKIGGELAEKMSCPQRCNRARSMLNLPEVQRFLGRELYNRRVASDVTHDWVTKKYRMWSEIDPTEFFEVIELKTASGRGKSGRYSIVLKTDLNKLPRHVRTAIKGLSVDPKTGSVKVDLVDQKSALDQLCKLLGFTSDKLLNLDTEEVHLHFDAQDENA